MTDEPERVIGERVRRLRSDLGWTQRELALLLREFGWEIDPTGVTRLEQGQRVLQVRQLYVLAEALGASVQELLPDKGGDITALYNQLERELADARSSVVQSLYMLDRLRLHLDGADREDEPGERLKQAMDSLVEAAGSEAMEVASSNAKSAHEQVARYQDFVARLFASVAVPADEGRDDGEHREEA